METLRCCSWNVDGLARLVEATKGVDLPFVVEELGAPDVLCLQEARLRERDRDLLDAASRALPGYAFGSSLCRDEKNGRFRGGRTYGVATYVREDLEPRWLERPEWDREGRVLACEMRPFTLVNVYAPNGTSKPYFDHDLGREEGDRNDFKVRFQSLLASYVQSLIARTPRVLLMGDWNVSRSKLDIRPRLRTEAPHVRARALWNDAFIGALSLVDVFRDMHPEARAYTWFSRTAAARGRLDAARVDYALATREVAACATAATIAQDKAFRLGSDHAPLFVELTYRPINDRRPTATPPRPP